MPDNRYVIYRADLACERRYLRRTAVQGTISYCWVERHYATPMLHMQAEAVRDVLMERHGRKGWQFTLELVEHEDGNHDRFNAWLVDSERRISA